MKFNDSLVYVGTYTDSSSEGIYVFNYDAQAGTLTPAGHYEELSNPSFLIIDSERQYLYSVSEDEHGMVSSYRIDEYTGKLAKINSRFTSGEHPCHINLNEEGTLLAVVNYSGGSICVYPIEENGAIGEMYDLVQHSGHGPRIDRQQSAHPHSIYFDPSNQWILVPDLGLDIVFIYKFDYAAQKLAAHREVKLLPAAGPRHLCFHPSSLYVYVINELDSTITAFSWDSIKGDLNAIQTISTLPEGFTGDSTCADIHVSHCGSFLYGSNRGHDSIARYRIDSASGLLTFIECVPTGGRTPRNFNISPDGQFLFVANQDSDSIAVFNINQETGQLHDMKITAHVPKPICIKFAHE